MAQLLYFLEDDCDFGVRYKTECLVSIMLCSKKRCFRCLQIE